MKNTPWLSVCAPAYNEENIVEDVIRHWASVLRSSGRSFEILIANDGSQDNTGQVLANLRAEVPELQVVSFERNCGYGRALRAAVQESTGEYVLTIDSDGQFDVSDYLPLSVAAEQARAAVVTGYRIAKQDRVSRVVGDRIFNLLVRSMFGVRLRDTNCAIKWLRGDVARSLNIESAGFMAPTEILLKAQALGHNVIEVPVKHYARSGGASKLPMWRTSVDFLTFVVYLWLKIKLYRSAKLIEF